MSYPDPIIPKALPASAKIAFISPSLRINTVLPAPLARSIALFESLGHKVTTIFSNTGEDEDPVSSDGRSVHASIANRLAELRAAFAGDFDAVFCTIGGSTMTQLIPYLVEDAELLELVRKNPKIVVGYSDITVLHWSLRALTGLRTFYGPGPIAEFGEAPTSTRESVSRFLSAAVDGNSGETTKDVDDGYLQDFHLAHLLSTISSPNTFPGPVPRSKYYAPLPASYFFTAPTETTPRALFPTPPWIWLRPGRAEGRLFGGCLTVVSRIQGIPRITPDWRGKVLFLESAMAEGDLTKGNPLERVTQAVADLAARGVFDEISGLVIGRPHGYDSERARAEYAASFTGLLCHGRFAKRPFPILMNVDTGHTSPLVTLPMDAMAVLDSERDEFAIAETVVV
ncbi:LD-carboxypeptidase [Colletotrichum karsti]|uniref:LD-carboxypeptidase n=1 Tax=Colletotrichum karsti TaxID=1095194 RepID=A0A9P6LEE5_9PEZI|nr:LD-carboxypeptidase [Colletotrichum karsti]KAF9870016.1 LD-carboxypeptidase [Colletotrichum karsti]